MDVLFLTTIGRRIGQRRETPVVWIPDGAAWLIVASAAGSTHDPAWYHNLAAHPDQVWIELPRRNLRVVPEQLEGARREACPLGRGGSSRQRGWPRVRLDRSRAARGGDLRDGCVTDSVPRAAG
jgi:deazaflavin-dependent oxidoreductase (nitroreductase family)